MKTFFRLRIIFIGVLLVWVLPVEAGPVYPVEISGSNPRILVDQNEVPFLMVGDSPQSLVVNLSAADALFYMVDRATNGFNTLLVDVVCNTYTYGRANGSLLNGTLPFTGTIPGKSSYDLTAPNEAYFSYLDQIIQMAATNGIMVMLDPIETGGWLTTMLDNGTNNCRAYGQYLGNRYKNFPNIIWVSGNDFQGWSTPSNDAVAVAVALGIKDEDTNHLQTIELNYYVSSSLDDTNWAPIVGLNAAYTYSPTYAEVLHACNQSPNTPVFMIEANYEFENLQGPVTTAPILRKQEYWTLLSGGAGQLYGNHYTWTFDYGWQTHLDTPGAVEMGYVTALFAQRAWYDLVPDTNHTLVTAGYGTYLNSGYVADNNYVTAARTVDGALAIVYMPTIRTITINLAKFSGAVKAQWYDPSSGIYHSINGSPFSNVGTRNFTPPGNNKDGDGGWALVLTASDVTKPTVSISSPTNSAHVSNAVLTVTGKASDNVGVAGVYYSLNGGGWTTASGLTNWTATVTLVPGTNMIMADAADAAGNLSSTSKVTFLDVVLEPMTVSTNGRGTINPNYNEKLLDVGVDYSMTATAGSGFKFTNWMGSWTTNSATLKFRMTTNLNFTANFMDVTKPTVSISSPTNSAHVSNAVLTVTGKASDNVGVAGVYYSLNGGGWTTASGLTNWTATVTLVPGTNMIMADAADAAGNLSSTSKVTFLDVVLEPMTVSTNGRGTINPNYNEKLLDVGVDYSMTATAGSGFKFTNWMGSWTTNSATLKFRMTTNLNFTANFMDVTKPTVSISSPTNSAHVSNAVLTVTGKAGDNVGVAGVYYSLNGGGWTTASGLTNWTATVTLVLGTNTLKAYGVDFAGNTSTTKSISVISRNAFKLQLIPSLTQPMTGDGWNFSLQISLGLNGTIQVSTDLVNWLVLTNFVGTNSIINFNDLNATNYNMRFYRAVVP